MRFTLGLTLAAMSLVAATNARAESDGRPTVIVAIQPADGQVDVPIDVIPRVFTELSESDGDDFYSPRLSLLRGDEEVDSTQRALIGFPEPTELSPNALLEPNTTYTFRIENQDYWEPVSRSVTFTTGTEKATPIAAPPALEIVSAQFDSSEVWHMRDDDRVNHMVSLRVTPTTTDPAGLSMIRVIDGDVVYGNFILGGSPLEPVVNFFQVPGEEICLNALQVNATGEQQLSERVCVTSQMDDGGCQVTTTERHSRWRFLAGFALAVALLARRRRAS